MVSNIELTVYVTAGLPVEELGALFGDEVIVHLTADGQGIKEDENLTDDSHLRDLGVNISGDGESAVEKRVGTSTHAEKV